MFQGYIYKGTKNNFWWLKSNCSYRILWFENKNHLRSDHVSVYIIICVILLFQRRIFSWRLTASSRLEILVSRQFLKSKKYIICTQRIDTQLKHSVVHQRALVRYNISLSYNWPLTRYGKLQVVHASRMPGTFSPPSRVSDPDMHHGTCVTHVTRCRPGSLTNGSLWSRWRGKHSLHSRCRRNPQFYVSGKSPICHWPRKS